LATAIGVATFATLGLAQDAKPATTETGKFEKRMRGEGRVKGEGKHHGMRHKGRHGGMRFLHGLNLTDAQKEQIRSIRESNKPDAAVMQEMRSIHEAKKAGTEITAEQKERVKVIREQMQAKMQSVHEQIMGVLTAEQKAQIEAKKAEMKLRKEERRQKRQKDQPIDADKPKMS